LKHNPKHRVRFFLSWIMGRAEDDIPSPITLPLTMIKEEDCQVILICTHKEGTR